MTVWDEFQEQGDAVHALRAAAESVAGGAADQAAQAAMTHAWLITGPPGSGRSNLAYAFATALLSAGRDAAGAETVAAQVRARSHPDLGVLATERVIISIDEIRAIVAASQFSPSQSRFRVMVIEDADRMTERSSNVILKALEEPPSSTVWVLCAPSEADLLPTIRSRVRSLRLRMPELEQVASLVSSRTGLDADAALLAAREAQHHIGMAMRLATDADARRRRTRTLQLALGIDSVASALTAAAELMALAGEDAKALGAARDERERQQLKRSLGLAADAAVPRAQQPQLRALEEDQKRRATRNLRDGVDRILLDLLSLYRDILLVQLGVRAELVNEAIRTRLEEAAAGASAQQTLTTIDAITTARARIEGNVQAALAMEALALSCLRKEVSR